MTEQEYREQAREEAWARRQMREADRAVNYGMRTGAANCAVCAKFKPRPSSVCGSCGDDPVSHNGDRREYDRAHGYAGLVRGN